MSFTNGLPTIRVPRLAVGMAFALGLVLTLQWKSYKPRVLNPVEPVSALTATRERLKEKQGELSRQLLVLRAQNQEFSERLKREQSGSRDILEEVEKLKSALGLTALSGPGVVITLSDSPLVPGSPDSIAHASDMRDLVNFLFKNGAQGIVIAGERITITTSIDSVINTVMINNRHYAPPFVIEVVGDPSLLGRLLLDKKNLPGIWRRVEREGLVFEVKEARAVSLPAFRGAFKVEFAKVLE